MGEVRSGSGPPLGLLLLKGVGGVLSLDHVSYAYPGLAYAVEDLSLCVSQGGWVVVVGPSGSGKSTLAALASGSLSPVSGQVTADDRDVRDPCDVALVRQDPSSQFVSSLVEDDVAFGPRNLGLDADAIRTRVREALELAGILSLSHKDVNELSGGQRQLVALAGALALRPRYLVLDEVCSQLDSAAREALRGVVGVLRRRGVGILEVTHLVEELIGAEEVIVLSAGRAVWEGTPQGLFANSGACRLAGLVGPDARLCASLAAAGVDLSVALIDLEAACATLRDKDKVAIWDALKGSLDCKRTGLGAVSPTERMQGGLELDSVFFYREDASAYSVGAACVLADISLAAAFGRVLLLAGPSGSGKTTSALVMAGLIEADFGTSMLAGRPVRPSDVGLAFQRPEEQFFANTVLDDVAFGALARGAGAKAARSQAQEALERLGIERTLWDRSPLALSGGEARRVALAGIVAMRPSAYVLDEPTAGLDGRAARRVIALTRELATDGAAVVVISHEVGEWLGVADDGCLLREGRVVWSGSRAELLASPGTFRRAGLKVPLAVRVGEALGERR